MILSIDFETRSTVSLRKTGVYPYALDPTTDVWVMAYAVDDEPVDIWLPGDPVPDVFADPELVAEYRAWNAEFERVIYAGILVQRYGFPRIALEQWYDTAAQAAAMALPRGLGAAAKVLGLDVQKDMEGRALMLQMEKPRSEGGYFMAHPKGGRNYGPFPTKTALHDHRKSIGLAPREVNIEYDPDITLWWDEQEKLEKLIAYCRRDVEVERAVAKRVPPLRPLERHVYVMDQRANTRGFQVDHELVAAAQKVVDREMEKAGERLGEITGAEVTSVTDVNGITSWLKRNGLPGLPNLRKDTVRDLLEDDSIQGAPREVLRLRAETGKTSTAKLEAFQNAAGPDGRVRGTVLYHGASTGRWAGRLVQPQNFPRPEYKDVERFIGPVLEGTVEETGEPPAVVVASLLRSMIVADEGRILRSGDYSQIEARVLAWVAGQEDLVQLFEEGGKVYEDMASFIFGIPVEEIGKDSFERQIGKNSVLGAGFQMGADRFADQVWEQTGIVLDRGQRRWKCTGCWGFVPEERGPKYTCPGCGADSGWREVQVTEDLAQKAIDGYREKNDRIKAFWDEIYAAAFRAAAKPGTVHRCGRDGCIRFAVLSDVLWCTLPSGRNLAYAMPRIQDEPTPWGEYRPTLTFCTVTGPARKWMRVSTYGGHLTENVVQAIARDCMAESWLRLEVAGYPMIMTVHDELVAEPEIGHGSQEEFETILATRPTWAQDLPIAVDGWEGQRYRK